MLSVKTDNACHSRSDNKKRDFISDRTKAIPPSGIRRFFDLAGQMEDVISLGVESRIIQPHGISVMLLSLLLNRVIRHITEITSWNL